MTRVRVALFELPQAAEVVRQRLEKAGIAAEIHAEACLASLWFVFGKALGARLEVPIRLETVASRLLAEWDVAENGLPAVLRCPECGSFRVDYPQVTHKSVMTNLALGLIAVVGLLERDYYCEDCHCMWAKPRAHARPAGKHMGPNYFLEESLPARDRTARGA
jgi:hypothetical protein